MIGLLLKDMLVMRKTLRSYVLFLIFYAALAAMGMFQISVITAMIQVVMLMLPIGAFSYDEQAKWDRYAMSLPLGRKRVVGARYLFALLLALFSAAFGLLTCVLLSFFSGSLSMTENLISVMVSLSLGLVTVDILLPLCYKLGPERARPYLYAVLFIPFIALFGAAKLGLLDALDLSALERMSQPSALALVSLLPLAALAGLGVSWLISCRIVAQKEF